MDSLREFISRKPVIHRNQMSERGRIGIRPLNLDSLVLKPALLFAQRLRPVTCGAKRILRMMCQEVRNGDCVLLETLHVGHLNIPFLVCV